MKSLSLMRAVPLASLLTALSFAQGTLADYQRGQGLQAKARGMVVNLPATPNWIGDSDHL